MKRLQFEVVASEEEIAENYPELSLVKSDISNQKGLKIIEIEIFRIRENILQYHLYYLDHRTASLHFIRLGYSYLSLLKDNPRIFRGYIELKIINTYPELVYV
jgi:hypothetical protein